MLACKCCKLGQFSVVLPPEKQNPEQIADKTSDKQDTWPSQLLPGCQVLHLIVIISLAL